MEEAGDRAPFVLAALMCHGESFDPVARERLRNLAAKLGGVGRRTVSQTIKDTVQQAKRTAAEAARTRGESRKTGGARDSREELVLLAGQRPKVLHTIEARLGLPANVGGGAIVARGQATVVLRYALDPVRLRAGQQEIELPSGSAYLAVAKPEHLQAQLDRLFALAKVSKGRTILDRLSSGSGPARPRQREPPGRARDQQDTSAARGWQRARPARLRPSHGHLLCTRRDILACSVQP